MANRELTPNDPGYRRQWNKSDEGFGVVYPTWNECAKERARLMVKSVTEGNPHLDYSCMPVRDPQGNPLGWMIFDECLYPAMSNETAKRREFDPEKVLPVFRNAVCIHGVSCLTVCEECLKIARIRTT